MKVFIILAVVVAMTLSVEFRAEDLTYQVEDGPSINIFELIQKLINIGLPVACGTEVGELIDQLNLPQEIVGLLNMAKSIVCVNFSENLTYQVADGPSHNIFELIQKLLEIGLPVACGTEVGELIDQLNLPQEIIGLLNLAKSIVCPK
ncbi:uncharacterized protein LOC134813429 [Bolinopsis microptera]|uniref:uncharacterized protein LOC134813429 n=1 Tax=Bolinopsis microptera TaxID=2820187 RepID=UPI00307A6676